MEWELIYFNKQQTQKGFDYTPSTSFDTKFGSSKSSGIHRQTSNNYPKECKASSGGSGGESSSSGSGKGKNNKISGLSFGSGNGGGESIGSSGGGSTEGRPTGSGGHNGGSSVVGGNSGGPSVGSNVGGGSEQGPKTICKVQPKITCSEDENGIFTCVDSNCYSNPSSCFSCTCPDANIRIENIDNITWIICRNKEGTGVAQQKVEWIESTGSGSGGTMIG
jgi:hypothetical protein